MSTLIEEVARLEEAAFGSPGSREAQGPSAPYTVAMIEQILAGPSYRVLLASAGEVRSLEPPLDPRMPVARADAYLIAARSRPDRLEELHRIGVDQTSRREGLGQRLLVHWIEMARSDCERLLLEVSEANEPAWRLYEKVGFAPIGRRLRYYPDGSAARIYELRFV